MTEEETIDEPRDETQTEEEALDEQLKASGEASEPTLEEQLATEQDRALRLQAELQNVLMRKSRDVAEERKYGPLALMRDLLPVLDNVDRAIEAAEKSEESDESMLEGFRLVRQQLFTLLAQHECKPIETGGVAFNPDLHEAILQQPSAEIEAGLIVMETQSGYVLHDRVVRPAQVIVSSGPPAVEA